MTLAHAIEPTATSSGALGWSFSAPDPAFDYLAAGERATLTYAVRISDPSGRSVVQNVTITVTGTNDAPVIAGGTTTAVRLERTALTGSTTVDTATGAILFTDADFSDTHTATVAWPLGDVSH